MSAPYNGECLCGAVRFTVSSEPLATMSCYCKHCYKGAGGVAQVVAKFHSKDLSVTTSEDAISVHIFNDTTTGNPKEKAFCKSCGCPLWTIPASYKGKFHLVRTPLLENGLEMKPDDEIFTKYRPSWATPAEGIPQWQMSRQ